MKKAHLSASDVSWIILEKVRLAVVHILMYSVWGFDEHGDT